MMTMETANRCLELLDASPSITTLDITGGAPELNPTFRHLVTEGRKRGKEVIDRCNLTVLMEPDQEDLADFLVRDAAPFGRGLFAARGRGRPAPTHEVVGQHAVDLVLIALLGRFPLALDRQQNVCFVVANVLGHGRRKEQQGGDAVEVLFVEGAAKCVGHISLGIAPRACARRRSLLGIKR